MNTLENYNQFVAWKAVKKEDGKVTKIPYISKHKKASVTKSKLLTYKEALELAKDPSFRGIGFVFREDDPFTFIDLDNCIEAGKLKQWVKPILKSVTVTTTGLENKPYIEFSQSKRGIHIIVKGKKTTSKCKLKHKEGEIEVYEKGRFCALTGKVYKDFKSPGENQKFVEAICKLLEKKSRATISNSAPISNSATISNSAPSVWACSVNSIDDQTILDIISHSKQQLKFLELYDEGRLEDYKGDTSKAVYALHSILIFYTQDLDQVDRLFKQSALYKGKWIRKWERVKKDQHERLLASMENFYSPETNLSYHPGDPIQNALNYLKEDEHKHTIYYSYCWYKYCKKTTQWIKKEDDVIKGELAIFLKDRCAPKKVSRNSSEAFIHQLKLELSRITAVKEIAINSWLPEANFSGPVLRFNNGLLDLDLGVLLPHSPLYFSPGKFDFDYKPKATCNTFKDFLDSIWPDDLDIQESLQSWFGYLLSDDYEAQKAAILIGARAGGKSTLINIATRMIGKDLAAGTSLNNLCGRFSLSHLIGKKLVTIGDVHQYTSKGDSTGIEILKSVIGRDQVIVEKKFSGSQSITLDVKFMLASNVLPRFADPESAFSRRLLVFPFETSFEGEKQDQQLLEKLEKELSGIFNWSFEGYRKYQDTRKLPQSMKGAEALEELTRANNSAYAFASENLEYYKPSDLNSRKNAEYSITSEHLYTFYCTWCEMNGFHKMNATKFGRELASITKKWNCVPNSPLRRALGSEHSNMVKKGIKYIHFIDEDQGKSDLSLLDDEEFEQ